MRSFVGRFTYVGLVFFAARLAISHLRLRYDARRGFTPRAPWDI